MEKDRAKLRRIFEGLDDKERFGLCFGLFPSRLRKYGLDWEESAALIEMAQEEEGIEF